MLWFSSIEILLKKYSTETSFSTYFALYLHSICNKYHRVQCINRLIKPYRWVGFIIIYCFWYHNNIRLIVNNICVEGKVIDQLLLLIPVECQRLSDTTKASVSKINADENQRTPENLQNRIHGNILFTQLCTYVYYSCIHHNAFGLLFTQIHTLLRCVDFWWCCFHTGLREKKLTLWTRVCFLWIKSMKKKIV